MSELILCNGMVRSGSTLQYNLVKCILNASNDCIDIGFVDGLPELIEKIEFNKGKVLIGKAHSFYDVDDRLSVDGIKRFYIFRDLRDVAASLRKKLNLDKDQLFEALDEAVNQYYIFKNQNDTLVQKYENLFLDMKKGISEISEFLGIDLIESDVFNIQEMNEVKSVEEEIRKVNQKPMNIVRIFLHDIGLKRFQVYNDNLIHHNHISNTKGNNGDWREVLSKDEVKNIIVRYSAYLTENEYI